MRRGGERGERIRSCLQPHGDILHNGKEGVQRGGVNCPLAFSFHALLSLEGVIRDAFHKFDKWECA